MSTENLYVHIHVLQLQDIAVQMLPVKLSMFSLLDIESRRRPYCIKVGGFYLVKSTRGIFPNVSATFIQKLLVMTTSLAILSTFYSQEPTIQFSALDFFFCS